MLKKWYISVLIITVTMLGIFSQQKTLLPNQEILIQFTSKHVSTQEIKNTIASVKLQLQSLGVNNIQVKKTKQNTLKITYYSDTDVASIKETFSKEEQIAIGVSKQNQNPNKIPLNEMAISYNLDFCEIQNKNNADWNLNGVTLQTLDTKSDRFFDPNTYSFINHKELNTIVIKLAFKGHRNSVFTIQNTATSTPQVRAGPII